MGDATVQEILMRLEHLSESLKALSDRMDSFADDMGEVVKEVQLKQQARDVSCAEERGTNRRISDDLKLMRQELIDGLRQHKEAVAAEFCQLWNQFPIERGLHSCLQASRIGNLEIQANTQQTQMSIIKWIGAGIGAALIGIGVTTISKLMSMVPILEKLVSAVK